MKIKKFIYSFIFFLTILLFIDVSLSFFTEKESYFFKEKLNTFSFICSGIILYLSFKLLLLSNKFNIGPIQKAWLCFIENNSNLRCKACLGYTDGIDKKMCLIGSLAYISGVCDFDYNTTSPIKFLKEKLEPSKYGSHLVLENTFKKLNLRDKIGNSKNKVQKSLIELNNSSLTWQQIAKIIKINPEIYFTKSF